MSFYCYSTFLKTRISENPWVSSNRLQASKTYRMTTVLLWSNENGELSYSEVHGIQTRYIPYFTGIKAGREGGERRRRKKEKTREGREKRGEGG